MTEEGVSPDLAAIAEPAVTESPEAGTAPKAGRYQRYIEEITEDITNTVEEYGCQPILFVGSGLSKRYMDAPNWDELLGFLAEKCSSIDKNITFYRQLLKDPILIGEEFATRYHDWAWGSGQNEFPKAMFEEDVDAQSYVKYTIAQHLASLTPGTVAQLNADHQDEIEALGRIKPHAVITTNYDQMLEMIFNEYEPVVGQQILKKVNVYVGELFKIHGCVSDHDSIVFTKTDYDNFIKKKKFLSAKLLTFFTEHPLIFLGYRAGDPNIKAILSDMDEALPQKGGLIPNVYILQYNGDIDDNSWPARDKTIPTNEGNDVRVKLIEANDFTWVFDAFAANPALQHVSPKVLRSLIARSYELVMTDIPKMKVEADFKMLTESVADNDTFAKLFGLATINNYSLAAVQHPYSPNELAKKLGYKRWHNLNNLIEQIEKETGINIKSTANRYHRCDKHNKTNLHKYSEEAFDLLSKVQTGQPYTLDLGIPETGK